jgi:hypothetical protein
MLFAQDGNFSGSKETRSRGTALLVAACLLGAPGCEKEAAPPAPAPEREPLAAAPQKPESPEHVEPTAKDPALAGLHAAPPSSPALAAPRPEPAKNNPPAAPTAPLAAAPPVETAPAVPPPSPAAESPSEPVVSPKVGEASYSVWMQSSGRYKAGQQGVVEVVLVPKGDFHCNDQYPYKVKLGAPTEGVTYPAPVVRGEGASVSQTRTVMRVPFVAQSAGEARVAGKFYFSVCTSQQCVMDSRDLAVSVKVE